MADLLICRVQWLVLSVMGASWATAYTTLWTRLSPRQLNIAIQAFSLVSIFFEGYDQGVMGGVNNSPTYVTKVRMGKADGTVTNHTHQGGIVSVYYLGAIFGCFAGGWLADRIGRINGLLAGSVFALVGGALQSAAQNSNFMICARVVTGIGTGGAFIIPASVLFSEVPVCWTVLADCEALQR